MVVSEMRYVQVIGAGRVMWKWWCLLFFHECFLLYCQTSHFNNKQLHKHQLACSVSAILSFQGSLSDDFIFQLSTFHELKLKVVVTRDVRKRFLKISIQFQFGSLKKRGFSSEWVWFASVQKNAVRFGYYSYLYYSCNNWLVNLQQILQRQWMTWCQIIGRLGFLKTKSMHACMHAPNTNRISVFRTSLCSWLHYRLKAILQLLSALCPCCMFVSNWVKISSSIWKDWHFTKFNMAAVHHLGFVRGSRKTIHKGRLMMAM